MTHKINFPHLKYLKIKGFDFRNLTYFDNFNCIKHINVKNNQRIESIQDFDLSYII
jgi:hypothetical protein